MNILLPIIRRKRRPLIEDDVQPVVAVPPAPPAPQSPLVTPPAVKVVPVQPTKSVVSNADDTEY